MNKNSCVVIILTFNSQKIIGETVSQALQVTNDIFVVDSGSSDSTLKILNELGCMVVSREFKNYSDQRNWAINQMNAKYAWQLHLDADEVLDDIAIKSIRDALANGIADCYLIKRRNYFMGKMLKFSGLNPWHLRLFRSGKVKCESRLYDQHFMSDSTPKKLKGYMHDKESLNVSEWTARHNRWSDAEVEQVLLSMNAYESEFSGKIIGDERERTRYLKNIYYKLPVGIRAFSYFIYRYFIRLGFLDGRTGFYYAFLQALWFRLLVDIKLYEKIKNNHQSISE